MSGSQLFWSSGTWMLFAGQVLAMLVIGFVYWYQGEKEKQARKTGGCCCSK